MKARILKFYGSEIVARYYLNLGTISVKDARNIIECIMQSDAQSRYITSSEYSFSYVDEYGFEISFEKELLLPHNVKRCNENLEKILKDLNHIKKQNKCKYLKIELSKKLR